MFESRPRIVLSFLVLVYLFSVPLPVESQCKKGCDLALGSFYVWRGSNLPLISRMFSTSIPDIVAYNNKVNIPNQFSVIAGTRINIPFRCDCLDDEVLGHSFPYKVKPRDTYDLIARNYSDVTTVDLLKRFNSYPENNIPDNVNLSVVVNCYCGNSDVSKDYGLFVTYPLRAEENLTYVASTANVSANIIRRYNPEANFSSGKGIIFIPGKAS
ncbi:lysM domain receptor-like kinase 3 [Lycium ferocissimum]|uniref:lysM domain receptor-like kinase 3 n=1 Tax=Lycium ferocissimum TaxID=112874 RepID=UPI0028157D4C|nr:lysM domain receptor-like kinase 3 [Lycium ferocissimum]